MMISVASLQDRDLPMLVDLLAEMDAFYGDASTLPYDESVDAIRSILLNPALGLHALAAHHDDKLTGLATYSYLWPAVGLTHSLYLKELYVRASHRRRGVGRLLVSRVLSIAAEASCSRVEWTTDRANSQAQEFYKSLGTPINEGKVFYRLQGPAALAEAARVLSLDPPFLIRDGTVDSLSG